MSSGAGQGAAAARERMQAGGLADARVAGADESGMAPSGAPEREREAAVPANDQVGLGIDLVDIARMRRILQRTPSFARKVFSEAEQAYCDARANPESHYATRFAAKEAVVKALGTGFTQGITVRDIEVVRTSKGTPRAVLHGRALEVARERGVRSLPISLSFTHDEAVACAMAITDDSLRAMESRVDPMKQLAQQFKQARSLLDKLDAKPATAKDQQAAGTAEDRPTAGGTESHPAADTAENQPAAGTAGDRPSAGTAGDRPAAAGYSAGESQAPASPATPEGGEREDGRL